MFRLRRASKLMKLFPFLELTLARWRAQVINHRVLISAFPSLDKRTQRTGEWRVHRPARGYLELYRVRYTNESKQGSKRKKGGGRVVILNM